MNDVEINIQRLPPQDLVAEKQILGACMLDSGAVLPGLLITPADFYRTSHGAIFGLMRDLHEKGVTVDLVTLSDAMRSHHAGLIEKLGGLSYLSVILSDTVTTANVKYHEAIVLRMAALRNITRACDAALGAAYNLADPEDIITPCITALSNARRIDGSRTLTYRQLMRHGWDMVEKRSENPGIISGIPWGFPEMDRRTDGLHPEISILAARPRMGKTAFALQLAEHAARHFHAGNQAAPDSAPKRVGVVSIEMAEGQLALREMARLASVSLGRLRSGELQHGDWQRINDSIPPSADLPVLIEFNALTDAQVERRIDDWCQLQNVRLVIVDYLQLVHSTKKYGTREEAVAAISRMLVRKKKEYGIPIIALAQLNRAVEGRAGQRPQLSDLRESGAIEQDADNIFFLHRPEVYQKCSCGPACICGRRGKAEIICEKQRMGDSFIAEFEWTGKWQRFAEKEG